MEELKQSNWSFSFKNVTVNLIEEKVGSNLNALAQEKTF